MEHVIRESRLEDAAAIYKLNSEEMGYDYSLNETVGILNRLLFDAQHKIYVAEFSERVVGYVHIAVYELLYAPKLINIMGIAVSSSFQRMGIGKALLEQAELWAKEIGASGVRVCSGSKRSQAHALYRSMGYGDGRTQLNFKKMFEL